MMDLMWQVHHQLFLLELLYRLNLSPPDIDKLLAKVEEAAASEETSHRT